MRGNRRAAIALIVAVMTVLGPGCGDGADEASVVVPDVAGLGGGAAQERLAAAGLTAVASVDGPAGGSRVVSQDPPAGERVAPGSPVAIALAPAGDASRRP